MDSRKLENLKISEDGTDRGKKKHLFMFLRRWRCLQNPPQNSNQTPHPYLRRVAQASVEALQQSRGQPVPLLSIHSAAIALARKEKSNLPYWEKPPNPPGPEEIKMHLSTLPYLQLKDNKIEFTFSDHIASCIVQALSWTVPTPTQNILQTFSDEIKAVCLDLGGLHQVCKHLKWFAVTEDTIAFQKDPFDTVFPISHYAVDFIRLRKAQGGIWPKQAAEDRWNSVCSKSRNAMPADSNQCPTKCAFAIERFINLYYLNNLFNNVQNG